MSVWDVDIVRMNPYQPLAIPHLILIKLKFQSRILIYAGSNIYDELVVEEKVFERNDKFSKINK